MAHSSVSMFISNISSIISRYSTIRAIVIIYSQPAISVITKYRLLDAIVEASLLMLPWRNKKKEMCLVILF